MWVVSTKPCLIGCANVAGSVFRKAESSLSPANWAPYCCIELPE